MLMAPPNRNAQVEEITKLKAQNGLLVLERAFDSRLKASKEACFKRWKNRHYARKKMIKLFGICDR